MQQIAVRLKLLPDADTRERLLTLIRDVNECANWIAAEAWLAQTFRRFDLHHLVYRRSRECFPLRANTTCGAIAKAAASYAISRNSRHTIKTTSAIELHQQEFRVSLDARIIRVADAAGHVSVPFVARDVDVARLANGYGQGKLQVAGGDLYFILPAAVQTPDASAERVIGVDLGIANIATDSEGVRYSGAALRGIRYRRRRLRAKLAAKGTRSAKRRAKRLARRERLFARDTNHVISKRIVADAERTKSAIALEELRGIRTRIRASRQQRAVLHSWSFGQLRQFITYKAALAGVPVVLVNARNSSRECSSCGHADKRNRPNQATFKCRLCGFTAHADYNAALVIRDRGRAALGQPYAAGSIHLAASPLLDN